MNENKRLLALFGVVAVIVIVILVICFWPEPDKTFDCKVKADADYEKIGSITYENYECLKDEDKFALVTKQDLSDKEKKALNETANQIGTGLYFLSEDLSKDELNDIKDDLGDDYKEDSLIIVEDGKITDVLKDKLSDSDAMLDFLEKANFAKWKFGAVADEEYFEVVIKDDWQFTRFDKDMEQMFKDTFNELGIVSKTGGCIHNPVGGCDSTPMTKAGVKSVTFAAQNPVLTHYYHTWRDTHERFSMETVGDGFDVVLGVIEKIAAFQEKNGYNGPQK